MASRGYRQIAAILRQEWQAAWQGGRQLPSNADLCARFASTPVTVQRAMELLADQGFIVTRPTVGSYLAATPPGTRQIGLVFPGEPEAVPRQWSWTRLFEAFRMAAGQVGDGTTFKQYTAVTNGHRTQGFRRLCDDVASGALAGLVWSYSPHELKHEALIREPPIPSIHLNRGFEDGRLVLHYASSGLLDSMVRRAVSAGRRRPAVLTTNHGDPDEVRDVLAAATGTVPPQVRCQGIDPFRHHWLPNVLAAALQPVAGQGPDALLITDDHLVGPAVEVLADLGVRVPDDLLVIGEWNFPLPYRGALPVHRLGFDAAGWLRRAARMVLGADDPAARHVEIFPIHVCDPNETTPHPLEGAQP